MKDVENRFKRMQKLLHPDKFSKSSQVCHASVVLLDINSFAERENAVRLTVLAAE